MYELRSIFMKAELPNNTAEPDATPNPPPPHFDDSMIAVAQPVEPLNRNPPGPASQRGLGRFLKSRWKWLAALFVVALFGAVFGGMLLGLREEAARPMPAASPAAPVASQPIEEAPKTVIAAQPIKVSDQRLARPRRAIRPAPARGDFDKLDEKNVARKVGEIYYGWRKEDRKDRRKEKRPASWRK